MHGLLEILNNIWAAPHNVMDLPVLPLHRYPEYTMQCCELINDEWKRSVTARMRGLECSCDDLPTCLILLKGDKVIGHCKLSVIPNTRDACFIESVVIDRTLRGQGYGKYLMMEAEEYCKKFLSLKTIYLSTKGQELFYSKLGYNRCQPISIYGNPSTLCISPYNIQCATKSNSLNNHFENKGPKPPPMPKIATNSALHEKVYMNKTL